MAPTYSGIIDITGAGTAFQGPDSGPGSFYITYNGANSGYGYAGNVSGSVSAANGLAFNPGDTRIYVVRSLKALWFAATAAGTFSWAKFAGQEEPASIPLDAS